MGTGTLQLNLGHLRKNTWTDETRITLVLADGRGRGWSKLYEKQWIFLASRVAQNGFGSQIVIVMNSWLVES
ncbi:hypothetical protein TNCV_1159361 [Trichonephila clavipes]|nr:hypothetical protein TNCV_1159361 [Trichonephila clavipes]